MHSGWEFARRCQWDSRSLGIILLSKTEENSFLLWVRIYDRAVWLREEAGKNNKPSRYRSKRSILPYQARLSCFSSWVCISSVISVVNSLSLSLYLKQRTDACAHLYSRCKVWVTRSANINCHYEVRWKEARPGRKEIYLLVCQNAFSFLGEALFPSHTNRA